MILNPAEHHLATFLRALTLEVAHAVRHVLRTGLIAFFAVVVVGGIILTLIILGLGQAPTRPLAEVSYALLGIAALSAGVAAAALQLSVAVLQAIERASRHVVEDIDKIEGKAVRSLLGIRPEADEVPAPNSLEASRRP